MADRAITIEQIVDVITEIQTICGEPCDRMDEQTCPIGDLPGFDSLRALEATVLLEERLNASIGGQVNLFVSEDGTRSLTIRELSERMNGLISRKKEKKDE